MNIDISHIALMVSGASLCVSLYMAQKQKGLSAIANSHMNTEELLGYRMSIYMVNSGREPITLKNILITTCDGQTFKYRIRSKKEDSIKLSQSEFHEVFLSQNNSDITTWVKSKIKSAKIVDSYGNMWNIKEFSEIINTRHHASESRLMGFRLGDLIGRLNKIIGRRDIDKAQD